MPELDTKRRKPAEERCRQAAWQLGRNELLKPDEFAARACVSVTTVRRMLAAEIIREYRPTPRRIRICHWDRKKLRKRI